MAEIRVERAPRRRGWVWVVVILLLLALAWYLWATGVIGGGKTTPVPDTTRTGSVAHPAAVTALHDAGPAPVARGA